MPDVLNRKRAPAIHLWLALTFGLLLRAGCLAGVEYDQTQGDAASYRLSGLVLLDHGVYSVSHSAPFVPSAYRPPGYPVFLAMVFALSRAFLAVQLTQIVLSLLAVVVLSRVAGHLDPRAAVPVLWLGALNPFDAVYAGAGLSECVTTFIFVALVACAAFLEGPRRLMAMGILAGLLCLLRDIYLALIPFAVVAMAVLAAPAERRVVLRSSITAGLIAAVVILPWTVRNYLHFGRVIPVSAGRLGLSLWSGTWAIDGSFTAGDAQGERRYPDVAFLTEEDRRAVDAADPADSEPLFKRLFIERVKAEPFRVLGRWIIRWPRLWLGTRFDIFDLHRGVLPYGSVQWKVVKVVLFGINAGFVFAAIVGAWLSLRARTAVRFVLVPIAFTALAYLPLNSFENRYSQPMFPFLTLLAGAAIGSFLERANNRVVAR